LDIFVPSGELILHVHKLILYSGESVKDFSQGAFVNSAGGSLLLRRRLVS